MLTRLPTGDTQLESFTDFAGIGNRHIQVIQESVLDPVNPPMNGQFLPLFPSVLNYRRIADVERLFDHVQLAEPIQPFLVVGDPLQSFGMFLADITNVPQPVVDQSEAQIFTGGFDSATAVVSTDNHVLDLQDGNRVLDDAQAIEVGMDDDVGDVAVDEYLPGHQSHNLIGWDATVCATDPQDLRRLFFSQFGKELRIGLGDASSPVPVIFEKLREFSHDCYCGMEMRY